MSPSSLLYTPVELLRASPHEGAQGSHGEGAERRLALAVFGGVLLAALLFAAAAVHARVPVSCTGEPAAHGARSCEPGR